MTTTNQPTQAQWDAANRFLDRLLIDPILANGYQQISQQANGQDNAPEILTTWLQEQGYDTTPDLVYAALINLQNTSLTYWTGIYGQSFLGSSEPAPVLAIGPDIAGNTVAYLDGVELKNFVFESVETDDVFHPTLSWDLDSNQTAGNITFFYTPAVTLDPEPPTGYTGNWFEGSLQTSVSSVSQKYYGAIGEPTDSSAIPKLILADGKEESWWDKYSTYVYIGIGIGVVAIVIIGVLVYRRYNVPERNFEDREPEKTAKEWEEGWNEIYENNKEISPDYTKEMQIARRRFGDQTISEDLYWNFLRAEQGRLGTVRDLNQQGQKITTARDLGEEISPEDLKRLKNLEGQMEFYGGYMREKFPEFNNFEPQRRTGPSFQPPVSKISKQEIKKQKELLSKLDLDSLNYIAGTNFASGVKKTEISRAIDNVTNTISQSQDPYLVSDWNRLIAEGKEKRYFDDPTKKFRYFDKNPTKNEKGDDIAGKLIGGEWYDQGYLDWKNSRDSWLAEVGQTLANAKPNNLAQKELNNSKVIEPKKPLVSKNEGKPGEKTRNQSGLTSEQVVSNNPQDKKLNDAVFDSNMEVSKQLDNQKDPKTEDRKKSNKETEKPKPSEHRK